ncbi:hypothetical protein I302_105594 [Kwoniella bestiolae CBS 10118]|uniref:Zn(2)-C6 fungal-type domain-containing protein n=1 Tax=Kwoniella bestiolae CBS 10118 TaxID=1296100 RepID=A0A1B9G1K0_9TREE|nr:hypothetical protein I302_04713 [Kwoniella bestiolae CBS 10118]OCF24903.1 hypothetical protein I302_04713 [Kwoniella bestiolae CBS 10118]
MSDNYLNTAIDPSITSHAHVSPTNFALQTLLNHNPSQIPIAGPSYINAFPHPRPSATAPTDEIGGRPARSRKNRPCDSCRRRKTRCLITAIGPPCSLCADAKRECTFNFAPPARKPRQSAQPPSGEEDIDGPELGDNTDDGIRAGSSTPSAANNGKRTRSPDSADRTGSNWRRRRETSPLDPTSMQTSRRNSSLTQLADTASSFDHLAVSGFEPHVLTNPVTDDLLPIQDEEVDKPTDRPHVKQISSDPKRPIFVVMQPRHENFRTGGTGMNGLTNLRTLISHQPTPFSEPSLIAAYTTHVHPARPILPKGKISRFPPNLLAAILASSFAHSKDTRSLAGLAANLLQSASEGTGESNLVTVITNIMMIGVRPGATNQGSYLLLAHTIALAQLLGLHLDPSSWSIPTWEQELRIRLWWMLRIHDAWMSFLNSRPSHIQANNSTAPLPQLASLLEASCAFSSASSDSAKSFIASCRLARLVSRLQSEVCTLGAVADRSQADRKEEVEDILHSADSLLRDWRTSLGPQVTRPPGVKHGLGAMFSTPSDTLEPFTEFITFITSLTENDLDGYFLSYCSHILSSVLASLVRFVLGAQTEPNVTALDLIARLVRSLHQYQTTNIWDIAGPALRRAATMGDRLRKLEEHVELSEALRGSSSSTPGDLNLESSLPLPVAPVTSGDVAVEPQLLWDWTGAEIDFDQLLGLSSTAT